MLGITPLACQEQDLNVVFEAIYLYALPEREIDFLLQPHMGIAKGYVAASHCCVDHESGCRVHCRFSDASVPLFLALQLVQV